MFRLEMLPASCGDCLWLEYGDPRNAHIVVIDGGTKATAAVLGARIRAAMAERHASELKINLLVITHYDNDHIDGVLELLEKHKLPVTFGDIWFNGDQQLANLPTPDGLLGDSFTDTDVDEDSNLLGIESNVWSPGDLLGAVEGEKLSNLLRNRGLRWNQSFNGDAVMVPLVGNLPERKLEGDLKLTLLGPTNERLRKLAEAWQTKVGTFDPERITMPETLPDGLLGGQDAWPPIWIEGKDSDRSVANGSSIVLLAEYQGQRLLLAGDAHAGDLDEGLSRVQALSGKTKIPLPLSAFKLPHHGSANNLSKEVLERIQCSRYLVSTDGSKTQRHPDHQTLLRILRYGGPNPILMFNYKAVTTRCWQKRKQDVIQQGFPDYSTVYPDQSGGSLRVELNCSNYLRGSG